MLKDVQNVHYNPKCVVEINEQRTGVLLASSLVEQ
jgi:hypothetical protein